MATSTAPMVQFVPAERGRESPIWSVAPSPQTATKFKVVGSGIAPANGLPARGLTVSVGPPLAASSPSWLGRLASMMSPVPPGAQVVSVTAL
jgi:hypothetical protein